MINLAASPFDAAKPALRQQLAAAAAQRLNCPLIYLNQVGGNDELVFDGASFVVGADGAVQLELPVCEEHLAVWDSGHPTPVQSHGQLGFVAGGEQQLALLIGHGHQQGAANA